MCFHSAAFLGQDVYMNATFEMICKQFFLPYNDINNDSIHTDAVQLFEYSIRVLMFLSVTVIMFYFS